MEEILTKKQKAVLFFITGYIERKGYAPTIREIVSHFRLASPNSAKKYLTLLERKGYIKRKPHSPRAIEVMSIKRSTPVPIVGRIRAGAPNLAMENIEGHLAVDRSIARQDNLFLLRVEGDSMIEAHIQSGDLALIKPQPVAENGEIVAVLIDDEATLKRFYKETNHIRLQPANSKMKPIIIKPDTTQVRIIGKVISILRQFQN